MTREEQEVLDAVRAGKLTFKWGEKGADPRILIEVPMELREKLAVVRAEDVSLRCPHCGAPDTTRGAWIDAPDAYRECPTCLGGFFASPTTGGAA